LLCALLCLRQFFDTLLCALLCLRQFSNYTL